MIIDFNDLPFKARMFAEHCLENLNLRQIVDMIYSEEKERIQAQFDLSEEQWQDALYVVVKRKRRFT
jgi:hypothetical protein